MLAGGKPTDGRPSAGSGARLSLAAADRQHRCPHVGLTLKLGSMFTLDVVEGLRVSELARGRRGGTVGSTVLRARRAPVARSAGRERLPGVRRVRAGELAFVSRAKGIGMSLGDIAAQVAAWPTGECQSLQARLRAFLAGRIGQVREQLAELRTFEEQLQAVLDRLPARDPGPERSGQGRSRETDLDLAPAGTRAGSGPRDGDPVRPPPAQSVIHRQDGGQRQSGPRRRDIPPGHLGAEPGTATF